MRSEDAIKTMDTFMGKLLFDIKTNETNSWPYDNPVLQIIDKHFGDTADGKSLVRLQMSDKTSINSNFYVKNEELSKMIKDNRIDMFSLVELTKFVFQVTTRKSYTTRVSEIFFPQMLTFRLPEAYSNFGNESDYQRDSCRRKTRNQNIDSNC